MIVNYIAAGTPIRVCHRATARQHDRAKLSPGSVHAFRADGEEGLLISGYDEETNPEEWRFDPKAIQWLSSAYPPDLFFGSIEPYKNKSRRTVVGFLVNKTRILQRDVSS